MSWPNIAMLTESPCRCSVTASNKFREAEWRRLPRPDHRPNRVHPRRIEVDRIRQRHPVHQPRTEPAFSVLPNQIGLPVAVDVDDAFDFPVGPRDELRTQIHGMDER